MAALVSVSFLDKEFKVKETALTVQSLSMIFRLDANSGVYIHSQDGEIILPDEAGQFRLDPDETGHAQKKYTAVSGNPQPSETTHPSPSTSFLHPMGMSSSYQSYQQSSERSRLNPPPFVSAGVQRRPRFTTPSASATRTGNQWKKSFVVVDIDRKGVLTEL